MAEEIKENKKCQCNAWAGEWTDERFLWLHVTGHHYRCPDKPSYVTAREEYNLKLDHLEKVKKALEDVVKTFKNDLDFKPNCGNCRFKGEYSSGDWYCDLDYRNPKKWKSLTTLEQKRCHLLPENDNGHTDKRPCIGHEPKPKYLPVLNALEHAEQLIKEVSRNEQQGKI
jgi:hypothetical protein